MKSTLCILLILIFSLISCKDNTTEKIDYTQYHKEIIETEELVSQEKYEEALKQYESLISNYDFVFLRDYQIASQLFLFTGDKEKGLDYIKKGVTKGWELEDIKSQKILKKYLDNSDWKSINQQYDSLHKQFLKRIDTTIRNKVYLLFEKDQELAFKASLIEDEQEQEKFILENFSKHSEKQLGELIKIIETYGYPGEFLIGNNYWTSTILSHHNSISPDYVKNDTLYEFIKPKLFQSLKKGYISPYEIALIEDWKKAVTSDWKESPYGYLNSPNTSNISNVNKSRNTIGLRTVESRNKLIDIQEKTELNFYLPDWIDGKISIEKN